MTRILRSRFLVTGAAALALLGTSACGSSSSGTSAPATPAATSAAPALELKQAWVRAQDGMMTGMFGVLHNSGSTDLTVTSATSPLGMIEMHEVVKDAKGASQMQPKQGGFVVPAGGDHELKPGGDHIMLMGLKQPIKVGDQVSVTLKTSDGGTLEVTAIARAFTAEEEQYLNDSMGGSPKHTHSMTATPTS